jgi:hypothetical protein
MLKQNFLAISAFSLALMSVPAASEAATRYMPDNCSSFSACISLMNAGDTLIVRDGTYSGSITGVKAGTRIEAQNDGKVTFTGSFEPGSAGFTMAGIVVKSSEQKMLGANNTYYRMSFVGGPSCGNTKNAVVESNTKVYESAFYGRGGRYLLLAYKQSGGIVVQDAIFRPDGGWGQSGTGCSESEPHAAYNMYDTEGFAITRAIVLDAISEASGSENLGGQVVNTHESHSAVGTISQSVITMSGDYGRFASEGLGSHNVTITDSVARKNTASYGMTRNVNGTTTATRFDTDKTVGQFKGTVNRTTGANISLNGAFLNDPRWKKEMCTDAGVTRGVCGTTEAIGAYVSRNAGVPISGGTTMTPPAAPSNVRILR